jgi:cytochrome oxidase assembly protein ShyY1
MIYMYMNTYTYMYDNNDDDDQKNIKSKIWYNRILSRNPTATWRPFDNNDVYMNIWYTCTWIHIHICMTIMMMMIRRTSRVRYDIIEFYLEIRQQHEDPLIIMMYNIWYTCTWIHIHICMTIMMMMIRRTSRVRYDIIEFYLEIWLRHEDPLIIMMYNIWYTCTWIHIHICMTIMMMMIRRISRVRYDIIEFYLEI